MQVLECIVNNDEIKKSGYGEYLGFVRKSNETIKLKFTFSKNWDDSAKVVEFTIRDNVECEPQILINNMCEVPERALAERMFYIRILGKTATDLLTTKKKAIWQNGGNR